MSQYDERNILSALQEIEQIKANRNNRDTWVTAEILLGAAKSLLNAFRRWTNEELHDIARQAQLLLPLATNLARQRIERISSEVTDLRDITVSSAREKLQGFIDKIENSEIQNPSDLTASIQENFTPALSLISRITVLRGELDSMGDMIQPSRT